MAEKGQQLYLNKLMDLGCTEVQVDGKVVKLKKMLEGLPFSYGEMEMYLGLLADGWKRMDYSRIESLKLLTFTDCNAKAVPPLFKKLNKNLEVVFDPCGITFYGEYKMPFAAPLPF